MGSEIGGIQFGFDGLGFGVGVGTAFARGFVCRECLGVFVGKCDVCDVRCGLDGFDHRLFSGMAAAVEDREAFSEIKKWVKARWFALTLWFFGDLVANIPSRHETK